jgi:hypothetical protein
MMKQGWRRAISFAVTWGSESRRVSRIGPATSVDAAPASASGKLLPVARNTAAASSVFHTAWLMATAVS